MGLELPQRVRKAGLWTAASAGLLLLSACSSADQEQIKRLAMPEPATDRAPAIYDLWHGAWLAAILVGILMWGLIGWACFKYRRRADDEIPVQTRYNLPLEILYTLAPVVMVLVFFYFTIEQQNDLDQKYDDPEHTIEVVGQQWSWTFNYVEDDALDGQTTVFQPGTPAEPPTLYLPVDESVRFNLHSPDVIHDFWVPGFLQKMDVVPGKTNSFDLTPTREGTYAGKCAELCGVYHSRMLFNVEVVSAAEYAAKLQELEEAGNIGPACGPTYADEIAGLDETSSEVGQPEEDSGVNDVDGVCKQ